MPTFDEVTRKVSPAEPDRKLVGRRVAELLHVLGLQVNEATGEIEPRPGAASVPVPQQTNARWF